MTKTQQHAMQWLIEQRPNIAEQIKSDMAPKVKIMCPHHHFLTAMQVRHLDAATPDESWFFMFSDSAAQITDSSPANLPEGQRRCEHLTEVEVYGWTQYAHCHTMFTPQHLGQAMCHEHDDGSVLGLLTGQRTAFQCPKCIKTGKGNGRYDATSHTMFSLYAIAVMVASPWITLDRDMTPKSKRKQTPR